MDIKPIDKGNVSSVYNVLCGSDSTNAIIAICTDIDMKKLQY